jgi:hypothetical protein
VNQGARNLAASERCIGQMKISLNEHVYEDCLNTVSNTTAAVTENRMVNDTLIRMNRIVINLNIQHMHKAAKHDPVKFYFRSM